MSHYDDLEECRAALATGDDPRSKVHIPLECDDWREILYHSAEIGKYPPNNWLEKDGLGCSKKEMYASIFRHVAEAYVGSKQDKDSGLDPRLHAVSRLIMDYVREKRGLF